MSYISWVITDKKGKITGILTRLIVICCFISVIGCSEDQKETTEPKLDVEIIDVEVKGKSVCATIRGEEGASISSKSELKTRTEKKNIKKKGQVKFCFETWDLAFNKKYKVHFDAHNYQKGSFKKLDFTFERKPFIVDEGVGGAAFIKGYGVECKTSLKGEGQLSVNVPAGTKVTYGGVTRESDGKVFIMDIDLTEDLSKAKLSELITRFPVSKGAYITKQLKLEYKDGQVFTQDIKLFVGAHLRNFAFQKFYSVDDGPVLFGKEVKNKEAKGLLADGKLYGNPGKVTDIVYVAFVEQNAETKKCGAYYSKDRIEEGEFSVEKVDWSYTIRDRRTGEVVATKVFTSKMPKCPKVIKRTGTKSNHPDGLKTKKWFNSLPEIL